MEGKGLILSVLVLSLFVAQIQVDATSCPSAKAQHCFSVCRIPGTPKFICADLCGCQIGFGGSRFPDGTKNDIFENMGDAVNVYCKLGCVTSVCGALTTLQNSDESEIINGAVEKCAKACSTVCVKGSVTAAKTA